MAGPGCDTPLVATIQVHEVTPDRPDLLSALATVRAETDREINPDDPPAPLAELAGNLFSRTSKQYVRGWVAFLDGEPAGEAVFELETEAANRHVASSEALATRPRLRRRGVADALLRVVLDELAADGRTSLLVWAPDIDPDAGGAYAERLGLQERTEERCSRLRMDRLDHALVDRWLGEGEARTDGYRLVRLGPRCPDEHLRPYLEASASMGDAPTDDLEWQHADPDEALLRSREQMWSERGLVPVRTLALAPDGRGAGVSALFLSEHRPSLAWQGDTGVGREHRGRGLGRWLKAANLRYAREVSADFEVVETYNAQSNPWMLDINVAMGFVPHVIYRGFQGDLGAARAVVG